MELQIRKAEWQDIDSMMALFDHSRSLMRVTGNPNQWVGGYPQRKLIESDLNAGHSYVVTESEEVVGTFAFFIGEEPTYQTIYHGHWLDDTIQYGTLHRMARAPLAHGIADAAIDWCARQVTSLRADTHADNRIVQHLLERHNFVYCGEIQLDDGTWRRAYQRIDHHTVSTPLRHHVEREILPQYDTFDPAHSRQHILTVIAHSMSLARHYPVLPDMVYAIAAYHDLGMTEGRDLHHLTAGRLVRKDTRLRQWFDAEQIEVIAQAVEDHRASSQQEPRSIYGKIVAEADRDIDSEKIVLRTLQFGWKHYPHADKEEQWRRTIAHLHEKYSEEGYMKLWIPESANAERLAELRRLIADKAKLRKLFEQLYRPEKQS